MAAENTPPFPVYDSHSVKNVSSMNPIFNANTAWCRIYCSTQLKHDVLNHPNYPRLSQPIRDTITRQTALDEWGILYTDFLSATYVYLMDGINYRLPNGKNLF